MREGTGGGHRKIRTLPPRVFVGQPRAGTFEPRAPVLPPRAGPFVPHAFLAQPRAGPFEPSTFVPQPREGLLVPCAFVAQPRATLLEPDALVAWPCARPLRATTRSGHAGCLNTKLHRRRYSPYARKVQVLLDLLGLRYDLVDVPYGQRDELARVTGGYEYVLVLVDDDGKVVVESRDLCEHLLALQSGGALDRTALSLERHLAARHRGRQENCAARSRPGSLEGARSKIEHQPPGHHVLRPEHELGGAASRPLLAHRLGAERHVGPRQPPDDALRRSPARGPHVDGGVLGDPCDRHAIGAPAAKDIGDLCVVPSRASVSTFTALALAFRSAETTAPTYVGLALRIATTSPRPHRSSDRP